MAIETVRVSDVSRTVIQPGTGARVRVIFYDGLRDDRRADLTDEEVERVVGFTKEVEPRRGRPGEKRTRVSQR